MGESVATPATLAAMLDRFGTARRGFLRSTMAALACMGVGRAVSTHAQSTSPAVPAFSPGTVAPSRGVLVPSPEPGAATAPVGVPRSVHARPLYVLPILDGRPTPERALDVVAQLGRGGDAVRVGYSGVFRYMMDVDPDRDFRVITTRLEEIADVARVADVPFLVHLNGGRWAGGGPLVDRLMADGRVMAWDHLDRPWSYPKDGEYHFSLGAYNELVRKYKKRNLQVAAEWLAAFAAGSNGRLFAGVSTDSEVLINLHPWSDYNPLVVQEYVHWLSSDAIYDPAGGRWAGQGLDLGLRGLNQRYGTSFERWRDVKPPREASDSEQWRDWLRFRALLVDHNVQEQVDWIREAGIGGDKVYAHQSPAIGGDVHADVLQAAQVDGGGTGITAYGDPASDGALFERVRAFGAPWGIFEYNPRTDDEEAALAALRTTRAYGVSIVCPYHWDDFGGENEIGYTIKGTPFERALRRFVDAPDTSQG